MATKLTLLLAIRTITAVWECKRDGTTVWGMFNFFCSRLSAVVLGLPNKMGSTFERLVL